MNASAMRRSKLLFCAAAFVSLLLSVFLWFGGYKAQGEFVGLLGTVDLVSR